MEIEVDKIISNAKPKSCPRCGNKSIMFDLKTGFCANCCSEVDINKFDDKKLADYIEFEINGIQKATTTYKNEDYIIYKLEIPKSLNYWIDEIGRKRKFRIHIRAVGIK